MSTSKPHLTLFSDGLLSKHGLNDGDAPDEWLDWCDEQGIDYGALPGWRSAILPELVRRFLLPVIDQDVKLVIISTIHNPVRAETVDGQDVTGGWYGEPRVTLTPEYTEVPMTEVLRIAREQLTGPLA